MTSERVGVSTADVDDLDLARVDAYLAERVPVLLASASREDVAVRLGLLARSAPRVVPTVTGLYAFGRLPQLFFPEWGVVCMASSGTTLLDGVTARSDLDGPLPVLVEQCIGFVRERCGGADVDGGEYAVSIVREAIVNALVHRDLRKPSRVALRLFADRLEIWSPGGPPDGAGDLEELGREGGVSHPRNPLLASIARGLGYGEQLGRGLHVLVHRGSAAVDHRVELRTSSRDVTIVLPSRWRRPSTAQQLS
jgi:ATP-dependent DNA helicase RecG